MSLATELLALVNEVSRCIEIPPIRDIYIPPLQRDPNMDAEFGVIVLEDGSAGFFYAWLGNTLERMQAELRRDGLVREGAVELASRFASHDAVERTVGLGAVNAISQHLFRRTGYRPALTTSSIGLQFKPDDHVGMVGLFPSLARRLIRDRIRLTVIERKADATGAGDGFAVTLDPTRLGDCNKVLCTASTLINDTLDDVLEHCRGAESIALIGPSAGCLPDPLFERGVGVVGGSMVLDTNTLLDRLHRGEHWGESVSKYTISRAKYPGTADLLARVARPRGGGSRSIAG